MNRRRALIIVLAITLVVVTSALVSRYHHDTPKQSSTSALPNIPRPPQLPAPDTLTPATPADIKSASTFAADPTIRTAVESYLAECRKQSADPAPTETWTLLAARPVGDYILLWIGFPKIFDGGANLIYSKKSHRVEFTFLGGGWLG